MRRLSHLVMPTILVGALLGILGGPTVAARPRCHGFPATIVGTEEPDRLVGTPGRDVIVGLGETDVLLGRGGNDVLCGGDNPETVGPDDDIVYETVSGGRGRDLLEGGPGMDAVSGDGGRDRVFGGIDDDVVSGGSAADRLFGRAGNDELSDTEGDNTLAGGPGVDVVQGGPGDETLKGGSAPDHLLPQDGRDVVRGGFGRDVVDYSRVFSGSGFGRHANPDPVVVDLARGTATGDGHDLLRSIEGAFGGFGADTLKGTGEADFFYPGPQTRRGEIIRGRGGVDTIFFEHGHYAGIESYSGVRVDLAEGFARTDPDSSMGMLRNVGRSQLRSIEDVVGTLYDDEIAGDAGPNNLQGAFATTASGGDELRGRAGDDLIFAWDGPDDLFGGLDDDILLGGEGDDDLDGGSGRNENYGDDGIDTCRNPSPLEEGAYGCES